MKFKIGDILDIKIGTCEPFTGKVISITTTLADPNIQTYKIKYSSSLQMFYAQTTIDRCSVISDMDEFQFDLVVS
jgi:hypothetical protein